MGESDATNPMNSRVMASIHCLYDQLNPTFIQQENVDPAQQYKIMKILNHSQLIEGKEWEQLQQELLLNDDKLTSFDHDLLISKVDEYKKIKSQLLSAQNSLKITQEKKLQENLNDLMNKLNCYKSQNDAERHSIRHQQERENVLASTIKLNT